MIFYNYVKLPEGNPFKIIPQKADFALSAPPVMLPKVSARHPAQRQDTQRSGWGDTIQRNMQI